MSRDSKVTWNSANESKKAIVIHTPGPDGITALCGAKVNRMGTRAELSKAKVTTRSCSDCAAKSR